MWGPVAAGVSAGGQRAIHRVAELAAPPFLAGPLPAPLKPPRPDSGAPLSKWPQPSEGTIPTPGLPGQGPSPAIQSSQSGLGVYLGQQ